MTSSLLAGQPCSSITCCKLWPTRQQLIAIQLLTQLVIVIAPSVHGTTCFAMLTAWHQLLWHRCHRYSTSHCNHTEFNVLQPFLIGISQGAVMAPILFYHSCFIALDAPCLENILLSLVLHHAIWHTLSGTNWSFPPSVNTTERSLGLGCNHVIKHWSELLKPFFHYIFCGIVRCMKSK